MPCNYCKEPNHTAVDCPRLQMRRKNMSGPPPLEGVKPQSQRIDSLSISLMPARHDDAVWEAITPTIRDVR